MQVWYEGDHSILIKPHGASDESLINLWEKWRLIPSTRPVVSPAEIKTNTVEVYGANEVIDLTEFPRGFPIYGRRTGSFDFYVDGSQEGYNWNSVYTSIQQHIHGRVFDVILKDDEAYYYSGRMSVNSWKSDKNWSSVSINYDFNPYKLARQTMLEEWLWNPFNFDEDLIPDVIQQSFQHIQATGTKASTSFESLVIGTMPFTPQILLDSGQTGDFAMAFEYRNNVPIGIGADDQTTLYPYKTVDVKFLNGATVFDNPLVMLAATYPNTMTQIRYKTAEISVGVESNPFTFSIDFRQGRL